MKKLFTFLVVIFTLQFSFAQRQSEKLDRGVVAMLKSTSQVYVSWRLFATDPDEIAFNVYRQIGTDSPVKLNSSPITTSTNLLATISSSTSPSRIFVKPVMNDVEGAEEGSWNLSGNTTITRIVSDFNYQPLPSPEYDGISMNMKFCWPADLNGDGKYDYVIDRQNYGADTDEGSDLTDYASPFVEAYTSEGAFLWRVKMGQNVKICDGHNDMVTAYDMDGDGFSEVLMAVSEGTTFPNGFVITDAEGVVHNYNSTAGSAPQWIAVVNGQTGNLIDTIGLAKADEIATERADKWKNIAGHFIIAHLNGITPSLIYQYKNRQVNGGFTGAYDAISLVGGQLVRNWSHRFFRENTEYESHQVRVADVDGDGKDEFVEISYVVDDDGTLLNYAPNVAHGDRHCVTDIDPDRPGLEQFFIQQSNILGMGLWDVASGEMYKGVYLASVADVGRGTCAAFDPTRRGLQFFSTMDGYQMYDSKGNPITGATGQFPCEAIWWGSNMSRWHLTSADGSGYNLIFNKYNSSTKGFDRDFPNLYGEGGNYYLTGIYGKRAAFWGDILGDWREEIILPRRDASGFAVLSTDQVTSRRQYCLMQNPAYRCQTTAKGYYQTPDVDFYMAADMPKPPVAPVQKADEYIISADNLTAAVANGKRVMFDIRNPNSTISVSENLTPDTLLLFNPKGKNLTFDFTGSGKLSGTMLLLKSMQGDVTLNGNHDFTGKTRISEGRLFINGTIQSPVQLDARGVVGGSGKLAAGITLETGLNIEGGRIEAGNGTTLGSLTIAGNLTLVGRNNMHFDIDQTLTAKNDSLKIEGDFTVTGINHTIIINQLSPIQADTLTLITFTGSTNATVDNFSIKGLEGIPYTLLFDSNKIRLVLTEPRSAGTVTWTGAVNGIWNFQTRNFLNGSTPDFFVPDDSVYFNDNATTRGITLSETMPVAALDFNNTSDYSISGNGIISGSGGLKKTGAGKLSLLTSENSFTGGIDFSDGTLVVSSLKDGGLPSSIGASGSSSANWKMTNATLQSTALLSTNRNMTVVGKLTVNNPTTANSVFFSGNITGTGITLEVAGSGNLTLSGINNFSGTTVKSGKLISGSANANKTAFGSGKITLEGGTLQMFDVNTTSNTGPWTNEIEVPEGKSAWWNMPRRWIFNNKVTGAGTLTINVPYVRSDINMDWTGYSGRINFTGSDVRLNNTSARNMVNVHVDLGSGTNLYCANNGSGTVTAQSVTFGALSGSGNMNGINTYTIGAKNTNTTYSGAISSGSGKLIKNGTGVLTLSGANLYTGGTDINAGTLVLKSATATGAGYVTVKNDATLSLQTAACSAVTVGTTITLQSTAGLTLEINPLTGQSDLINTTNAALNGTLNIVKLGSGNFEAGQQFQIFNAAGSISGTFTQVLPVLDNNLEWDLSHISEGYLYVENITAVPTINADKKVKSVEYYDLFGKQVSGHEEGIVIRKTIYNNGEVKVEKIVIKE